MWEVPASRWGAVPLDHGGDGLAIITESKLGFAARDGILALSLLRAPTWPDAEADRGHHIIRWCVGRYHASSDGVNHSTATDADQLFSPPVESSRAHRLTPPLRWIEMASLTPSWSAPSRVNDQAYIVRLHETAGGAGAAVIELATDAIRAELVDLRETVLDELPIESDRTVRLPFRPYQLLTLRITRNSRDASRGRQ